jgi:hypothetical protein
MNDIGQEIVKSLQSVRDFHASVAKLLQIATSRLAELGWMVPVRSASCGSRGSKAVYNARYWMPEDGFQFYRNENAKSVLAFVAVVFDDAARPELVTSPIATCGWLRFLEGGPGASGEYQYTWCRIALANDACLALEGQWQEVPPQIIQQSNYYQIESARALVRPLMSIQSQADLETEVLTPMINELNAIAVTQVITDPKLADASL